MLWGTKRLVTGLPALKACGLKRTDLLQCCSPLRQTVAMATVFSVQADSEVECLSELTRLCEMFGLAPTMLPVESRGTGRWMARAKQAAPAEGEGRE